MAKEFIASKLIFFAPFHVYFILYSTSKIRSIRMKKTTNEAMKWLMGVEEEEEETKNQPNYET